MSSPLPKSIAILGAGITGLTAAFRLTQRGHRVRVFESTARAGGAIRSERVDDWLIEAGPNTLLAGDPALAGLIEELGLSRDRLTAGAAARNRYIVRRGRPVAVPLSPPALLGSALFSPGAKLRLASELLFRPRTRLADLSLEDFIRDHFGSEIVDYALNPLVTGIYAGDPKKLSARHAFPKIWEMEQQHGSLLRGQLASRRLRTAAPPESRISTAQEQSAAQPERRGSGIISFRLGLQMLSDALVQRLPANTLALRAGIEALVPAAPPAGPPKAMSSWSVVWNDGVTAQTEHFDAVIAALPAPALAQLRFGTLGERPLASLDAIDHPPVSTLFLGYRREQVMHPLDGFGVLVPAVEKRSVLGILFSSTLFTGRAPAGHAALTVIVGGTRQPELARLPVQKLLAAVEPDLRQLLGVTGAPVFQRHTFWPRAIPQYTLGYETHLDTMTAAESAHAGLFIGGQARDGIALPACVAAGERLARGAAPG